MSMSHEEGKLIICPYNTAHLIHPKKIQYHLVKCRTNYPTEELEICPMDATRHVPRPEFLYHLENCPKRGVVDQALVKRKSVENCVVPTVPKDVVQSISSTTDESWNDACHPTYDPIASSATQNVIRVLKNARAAEKKEFQRAERLRLIQLRDETEANGPCDSQSHSQTAEEAGHVRMPKSQSQGGAQHQ